MIQVTKSGPDFFKVKKKKVKYPKQSDSWSEISDIRTDLREYILQTEQESMCVYCEKKISSDSYKSNIDHFKTRNTHPELTLEYNNLIVSCNNREHCSSKKDNFNLSKEDFKKILNPVCDDIENSFSFTAFGELEGNNKKAKFTIEVFGLNHITLVEERKNILLQIQDFKEVDNYLIFEAFKCHQTLIKYAINS
ncbi:MAG: TIGR02646 family protein [Sulfurimonas sp.]|nr:TIGR02646 family protein [Sulfurimonas sp.]